jgi:hypothetical protein
MGVAFLVCAVAAVIGLVRTGWDWVGVLLIPALVVLGLVFLRVAGVRFREPRE